MAEDRLHRSAGDARAQRGAWWARALGALRDPPLRRPPVPRIEPVRRSWLGAFWHARIAVQAGLTLDDFLRSRVARYLAGLPVPRARLPVVVDVEDGQLAVRPAPAAAPAEPPSGSDAWLAPLLAADGPQVLRELTELQTRIAALEGGIELARLRVEERARQLAADVAVGLVAAPPDVDATAEQLGRPPIRSGAPHAAALTFAGAALAAETWQIALPILAGAGIDVADLRAEALRTPAEVVLAAVFSLAVATGIFALTHVALDAAVALFRGDADDRRRRSLASAALAAGLAAAVVAAAVSTLRPAAAGARLPGTAFILLLLVVPLATALVLRGARPLAAARAADQEAALAWDRERARLLGERIRRTDEISWGDDEVRALEARRAEASHRLRELDARAVRAARLVADAERREREALSRLAQSLVAALELDRYEFVRQASARGAHALLAPRRRKAPEAQVPMPEPAPEARLEPAAGRLAS